MNSISKELIRQYRSIFDNFSCVVDENDYLSFDKNKQLLLRIAEVEKSSLAVIDMARKNYYLLCAKYIEMIDSEFTGLQNIAPDQLFQFMYPEEVSFLINTSIKSFQFLDSLPSEKKKDYKLITNFRIVNKAGHIFSFIQQTVVLELDRYGNIWLVLKLIDLLPNKNNEQPFQRKMINIRSGESVLFDDEEEHHAKNILSRREKEILGLIYEGMNSKEISEHLFISLNTVNNHRQNILAKTNTKNTTQALIYARNLGII